MAAVSTLNTHHQYPVLNRVPQLHGVFRIKCQWKLFRPPMGDLVRRFKLRPVRATLYTELRYAV